MAYPTDFTVGGELAHEVSPASPGHCWGEAGRAHTTLQMEVSSQQATFGRKTALKRLTLILATMLKSPVHCLLLNFSWELRFVFSVAYVSISTCRSVSVGTFQFMQCPASAP